MTNILKQFERRISTKIKAIKAYKYPDFYSAGYLAGHENSLLMFQQLWQKNMLKMQKKMKQSDDKK